MTRRHFTDRETEIVRRLYPDTPTPQIAEILGRSMGSVFRKAHNLGLHKTPEFMSAYHGGLLNQHSNTTKFKPGAAPWNKGISYQAGGRSKQAQFKPGTRPHTWRPVGTITKAADGALRMKVADTGSGQRDWVYLHVVVWERANWPACAQAGKPLSVQVSEHKAKRSAEQNRLLWAVLHDIAASAWVDGRQFSADAWH